MDWRGCIPHAFLSKSTFYILGRPKVHPSVDNVTFLLSCTGFEFTQIRIIQQTYNHLTCFHFSPLWTATALRWVGKYISRKPAYVHHERWNRFQLCEDGNMRAWLLGLARPLLCKRHTFGVLGLELVFVCVRTVWLQADGNVNTQSSRAWGFSLEIIGDTMVIWRTAGCQEPAGLHNQEEAF